MPETSHAKKWPKMLRDRFSRYICEHDHQGKLVVVSAVASGVVALSGFALSFSLQWPFLLVFLSWGLAGLAVAVVVIGAVVSYDVVEFEKIARVSEGALKNRLATTKARLASAERAHKDYSFAIKGTLLPLAGLLQEIPLARTSAEARAGLGGLRGMAVEMLQKTAGTSSQKDAARATLYELDDSGEPTLKTHRGRPEQPRDKFVGESLEKVMKLINRGDTKRFEADSPDNCVTPSPGSRYKAVVATAIGRTEPRHGMLTVDSSDAKQLSDDDWPVIQSVGGMLAASYRIVTLVEELEAARQGEYQAPPAADPNDLS